MHHNSIYDATKVVGHFDPIVVHCLKTLFHYYQRKRKVDVIVNLYQQQFPYRLHILWENVASLEALKETLSIYGCQVFCTYSTVPTTMKLHTAYYIACIVGNEISSSSDAAVSNYTLTRTVVLRTQRMCLYAQYMRARVKKFPVFFSFACSLLGLCSLFAF